MARPNRDGTRGRVIDFKLPSFSEEHQRRRRRACSGDSCGRCLRLSGYCLVCSVSLFRALAPPALAVTEVVVVLVLYFIYAFPLHQPHGIIRYTFRRSVEDVVLLSLLRGVAVVLAYAFGSGRKYQTPYLYTAYAFAVVGIPFCSVKLLLYDHSGHHFLPPVIIIGVVQVFNLAHVLAAHEVVRWARSRYQMGLVGFGLPWEEGEEAWVMAGRQGPASEAEARDEDVSPRELQDPDSAFLACRGLRVHYKESVPQGCSPSSEVGVVLLHGYGGGAFAWRRVMAALARRCACRVLAFDRPGFGLTSRPQPGGEAGSNPYSMEYQAGLALQVAWAVGLRRVVLVGHGDGALLALVTAARADAGHAFHFQEGDALPVEASMESAWMGRTTASADAKSLAALSTFQVSPCGSPAESEDGGLAVAQADAPPQLRMSTEASPPRSAASDIQPSTPPRTSTPQLRGLQGSSGSASFHSAGSDDDEDGLAAASTPAGLSAPLLSQLERHISAAEASPDSLADGVGARVQPSPFKLAGDATPYGPAAIPGRRLAMDESQPWDVEEGAPAGGGAGLDWGGGGQAVLPQAHGGGAHHAGRLLVPEVVGLALLHPTLHGEVTPSFARLLARSRLGRRILRPLLRSELGEVGNRRAWADPDKVTPELLDLYRRPLTTHNWDIALLEVSRLGKRDLDTQQLCQRVAQQRLPCLVLTGAQDRIVPPPKAAAISAELGASRVAVLPVCGHLSHEEAPEALLGFLSAFIVDLLALLRRRQLQVQLE